MEVSYIAISIEKNADKKESPNLLIVAGAVVALSLAGFMGYRTLGPQAPEAPQTPPMTAQRKMDNDWVEQLAKTTGGDISKASPQDVQRLQTITKGMGAMVLKNVYAVKK